MQNSNSASRDALPIFETLVHGHGILLRSIRVRGERRAVSSNLWRVSRQRGSWVPAPTLSQLHHESHLPHGGKSRAVLAAFADGRAQADWRRHVLCEAVHNILARFVLQGLTQLADTSARPAGLRHGELEVFAPCWIGGAWYCPCALRSAAVAETGLLLHGDDHKHAAAPCACGRRLSLRERQARCPLHLYPPQATEPRRRGTGAVGDAHCHLRHLPLLVADLRVRTGVGEREHLHTCGGLCKAKLGNTQQHIVTLELGLADLQAEVGPLMGTEGVEVEARGLPQDPSEAVLVDLPERGMVLVFRGSHHVRA
mmetsp:Transcript_85648/g.237388  ORF Transcript_85648/g.237388 Transcript_85648/m.237388 type:complete len:312 (+) Transcript_85648:41-976(+)